MAAKPSIALWAAHGPADHASAVWASREISASAGDPGGSAGQLSEWRDRRLSRVPDALNLGAGNAEASTEKRIPLLRKCSDGTDNETYGDTAELVNEVSPYFSLQAVGRVSCCLTHFDAPTGCRFAQLLSPVVNLTTIH